MKYGSYFNFLYHHFMGTKTTPTISLPSDNKKHSHTNYSLANCIYIETIIYKYYIIPNTIVP